MAAVGPLVEAWGLPGGKLAGEPGPADGTAPGEGDPGGAGAPEGVVDAGVAVQPDTTPSATTRVAAIDLAIVTSGLHTERAGHPGSVPAVCAARQAAQGRTNRATRCPSS